MKHMKRANIYQCSNYNCTFNPETIEAHSFRWWRFVAKVDGMVIFNSYRYSNSTSKHQSKVRSLMSQLGIKIDLFLELPRGIKHGVSLTELITEGEETLCDEFLREALKRDERRFERQVASEGADSYDHYIVEEMKNQVPKQATPLITNEAFKGILNSITSNASRDAKQGGAK